MMLNDPCDDCSSFDFSCTGRCNRSFGVKLKVKAIKVPAYYSVGNGSIVLRKALDSSHPEHPYNWIKTHIGVDPEEFGVFKSCLSG